MNLPSSSGNFFRLAVCPQEMRTILSALPNSRTECVFMDVERELVSEERLFPAKHFHSVSFPYCPQNRKKKASHLCAILVKNMEQRNWKKSDANCIKLIYSEDIRE